MMRESIGKQGNIQIEPATWRDLNALRAVEQVCFPKDAWPLWDLIGVLTLPNVVRLKAMAGTQMIGFIAGDERPSEHTDWIATVGVIPEYRGRGIGELLLSACEKQLKASRIRLCVRVSNAPAIHLYEKTGYKRVGLWQGYYNDGEDAIVMEKIR